MNKKLKPKWVNALRSDDFQQGMGVLRTRDGKFCCLGLLRYINDPKDKTKRRDHFGPVELLSDERLKEFGLTRRIQRELAAMNDEGVPFPVLAGFIEENI